MPKQEDLFPVGSVVRLKKTGEFAIIYHQAFMLGNTFLHYEGPVEGKPEGWYAIYHDEVELEALPPDDYVAPKRKYSKE